MFGLAYWFNRLNAYFPCKTKKELDEFNKWAFGDDYRFQPACQLWMSWNNRHKDLYWVHCNTCIKQHLINMYGFWKEELREKANGN